MGFDGALHLAGLILEVFLLDMLLSGDNAVIIALACRRLPAAQRREVLFNGTIIAVLLRVVLALLASLLLRLPLLKLAGGITLVVIAVRLLLGDEEGEGGGAGKVLDAAAALRTIVIADVVMSIDNVMALAALTQHSVGVLAVGVALSVPVLMFGSWFVAKVLADYPLIEPLGAALLGWIAGSIAVSDPLYAQWVESQSPMLQAVVPALTAIYVLMQARIVRERRPLARALRPQPRVHAMAVPAMAEPVQQALAVPVLPQIPVAAAAAPLPVREAPPPPQRAPATVRKLPTAPFRGGPWVLGGGIFAAVATFVVLLNAGRTPAATGMKTYDCGSSGIVVSYNPGGTRIQVATDGTVVEGVVLASNQIDWRSAPGGTLPSGIPLPRTIRYASPTELGLHAEPQTDLACKLR